MDPNSDESKWEREDARQRQGDDSVSVAPAPSDGASATTGMLQIPDGAVMNSPAPVPDAQMFAALEQDIIDEEAAVQKPRGNVDVIDDEDDAPLPAAAMAASMNIEDDATKGKLGKGPEIIKGDDDSPPDHFTSLHDEEMRDNLDKKPAAAKEAVTQLQTQPMAAPPTNQDIRNHQDPQPHQGYNVDDSMEIDNQDPRPQPQDLQPQPRPHATSVPPSNMNQDGGVQNHGVQDQTSGTPQILPTPQSMLPRPNLSNNTQAPSAPILEARLVEEEAPAPVYEATVVQPEAELPWWKKHRRYILLIGMVLVLGVVVVVMGNLLGSQGSKDGETENNEAGGGVLRSGAGPTKSPTILFDSNSTGEEQTKNSTLGSGSNSTVEELLDPTSDKSPTLSPSESSSDKPANAPTDNPATILQSILSSQSKLLPNDGAEGDYFGETVSVNGDTVVVSAWGDDDNGSNSGSAYVYIREGDTWKQQAKLLPNDGAAGDNFGIGVAVSGDTVVVGARWDDDNGSSSGSAYVFIREGGKWIQQAKLLPNDGAAGDLFGSAVSVDGDTVVVGAPHDDFNGSGSGSAYVFIRVRGTWIQQAKLLPNDGAADDWFGTSVSVSGDTAVVGADYDDDYGSKSGSAYVFIREEGAWKQQAKLLPNDGAADDTFGKRVSVSGDTVVVGAREDDDNGSNSGSAYVFIREGDMWIQQAKLLPNDGAAYDYFGGSVSVSGNTVVVGANDDDNGSRSGSAYVFIREGDTWKQQTKLSPNDGAADDEFGIGVAVSGDTVVVGAWKDDDNSYQSGSAYIFLVQS